MMKYLRKMPILYNVARKIWAAIKSYFLRREIRNLRGKGPLKIVVGAGKIFESGWIPTEINQLNLLRLDNWEQYFDENSIDAILAEHVWEHLTIEEGLVAAENCYRYLKPKTGYLRIAVPDGYHPDQTYIESVKVNGTGLGANDHKVLYNCDSLGHLFQSVGFNVSFLEFHDDKGKFHFVDWSVDEGLIHRSKRFDKRNQNGKLAYTSLILDAIKK